MKGYMNFKLNMEYIKQHNCWTFITRSRLQSQLVAARRCVPSKLTIQVRQDSEVKIWYTVCT